MTVAIKGDRSPLQGADQEMRDPALILRPHLPPAVDAAHAQHSGGQIETACIIQPILVRRALGTALGGMEIERAALGDAIGAQMPGTWKISAVAKRGG